jgi:hypothetical protein
MMVALLGLHEHEDMPNPEGLERVPEVWLLGEDWGTSKSSLLLAYLEEVFAPAAVRGLVTSASDSQGHVAYRLTPAGRAFLDAPFQTPTGLPEFDMDAAKIFNAALHAAGEEIKSATPNNSNAVAIRLPCGLWPELSEAAPIPPIFTRPGRVRSLQSMIRAIEKLNRTKRKTA